MLTIKMQVMPKFAQVMPRSVIATCYVNGRLSNFCSTGYREVNTWFEFSALEGSLNFAK